MNLKYLLIVAVASILFAKTELSLSVGQNSFDGDEGLGSATSIGVRGDFYLDDRYHLDLGYDDLGSIKNSLTNTDIRVKRIYGQFSADGDEEYHVVPSLSLGLGYEKQSEEYAYSQSFLSLGLGFRYNVSNNLNFLLGTKVLWKIKYRDINYNTTFGIGYMVDGEPLNNENEDIEEVVIPKKELEIPKTPPQRVISEVVVPKEQVQKAPLIFDTKEVAVSSSSMLKTTKQPSIAIPPLVKKLQKISPNTYFVQVYAYSKNMPKGLLDKLSSQNYHVVLRHHGSITKALIGPYSSRYEAKKALSKIRKTVPKAFISKG